MASLASLQAMISTADAFLEANASMLAPAAMTTHEAALVQSLITQVQNTSLQVTDATALNTAVNHSRFSTVSKTAIAGVITQRAMDTVARVVNVRRNCQQFLAPCQFMTSEDWGIFDDTTKSQAQKVTCLGLRYKLLRVTNLSEQSIRHATAILASAIWPDTIPTPTMMLSLAHDIKTMVVANRTSQMSSHIDVYPDDPHDLPADVFAAAYADSPPLFREPLRYGEMLRRVVLRSSNRQLASTVPLSPSSPQLQRGGSQASLMQSLIHMLQGSQPNAEPIIRLLPPRQRGSPVGGMIHALQDGLVGLAGEHVALPGIAAATPELASNGQAADSSHMPRLAAPVEATITPPTMPEPLTALNGNDVSLVDEMERAAADVTSASGIAKRPATAEPLQPAKGVRAKRPAAAEPLHPAKKRPAAACAGRPKVPPSEMGTTVMYNGGKIHVSVGKSGYRVFVRDTDRVDQLVKWANYKSKALAWSAALDKIDGTE